MSLGDTIRPLLLFAQERHTTLTDCSLPLCFLPHSSCHLCYDELVYTHAGQVPGRRETRWTLSRWWIRRLLCYASGAA